MARASPTSIWLPDAPPRWPSLTRASFTTLQKSASGTQECTTFFSEPKTFWKHRKSNFSMIFFDQFFFWQKYTPGLRCAQRRTGSSDRARLQVDFRVGTFYFPVTVPWAGSKTFTVTLCSNFFFKCSHAVLSVIFGILRSFAIEIGDPNFFVETFFVEKKIRKLLADFFLGPKNFDFWPKQFSSKKSTGVL